MRCNSPRHLYALGGDLMEKSSAEKDSDILLNNKLTMGW